MKPAETLISVPQETLKITWNISFAYAFYTKQQYTHTHSLSLTIKYKSSFGIYVYRFCYFLCSIFCVIAVVVIFFLYASMFYYNPLFGGYNQHRHILHYIILLCCACIFYHRSLSFSSNFSRKWIQPFCLIIIIATYPWIKHFLLLFLFQKFYVHCFHC